MLEAVEDVECGSCFLVQWGCGFAWQEAEGFWHGGEYSVMLSAVLDHNEDVKGILGDIMEIRLLDQT